MGYIEDYQKQKADLAQRIYRANIKLLDFFDEKNQLHLNGIGPLLEMFLKLEPDHYAAALQAGNAAEGKSVSEILERQAARAE